MDRKTQLRKANRRYYQNRRNRLIEQLGGVCIHCLRDGIENRVDIEFDHRKSDRNWCMRKLGPLQRLIKIEQEAAEGRIQLLCGRHNGLKQNTVEDDELAAELRGENVLESEITMARKPKTETTETDPTSAVEETTTKKPRKPRYGKAYTSLLECMSAMNGEPTAKMYTLEVKVQATELCVMATSRAMALNAACELMFGEPRKTTDKDKCEMMMRHFVAPDASNEQ